MTTGFPRQSNASVPSDDSYVRDGSYAGNNYGSATVLEVKNMDAAGYTRWAYIKYDLSSVDNITSAKVRVYGNNNGGENILAAYSVATTSWTESGLTWSNKPTSGSAALDTVSTDGTAAWRELDITSYLQNEKAAGRNIVSIAIKSLSVNASGFDIYSKESTSNPTALLVLEVPPEQVNAPSNVSASATSATSVNLAWTDNSSNETSFKIERKEGSNGNWSLIHSTSANVTSYTDNKHRE